MGDAQLAEPGPLDPFAERGEIPIPRTHGLWTGLMDSTRRATWRSIDFSARSLGGCRARSFAARSLPAVRRDPLAGLHAALDEMALIYFEVGRTGFEGLDFGRIEAEIEDLIVHHDHRGVTDDPFTHHDDPPAPARPKIEPRRFGGVEGEWMTFASDWEPHPLAPGRARWMEEANNRQVHVGLLRHDGGPRPWLLLIHGAEMGRPRVDARLLRAERLHRELGVNVAMPVLPKHGPRGVQEGALRGTFPSMEMADNVHGLSQAIWDIRRTLTWIRTQDPTAVGIYGFSLGAYVASLLGGLEPKLDALVIGCPVVDLVDLFTRNTPPMHLGDERLATLYDRARLAHRPISPLHLDMVLPVDKAVLFGATADRLTDPVDQLSRLWDHWNQPQVEWIDGGHVTYFLKTEPIEVLERVLRDRNVAI